MSVALAWSSPPVETGRALGLLATTPQSSFDSAGTVGVALALCAAGAWVLVGWLAAVASLAGLVRLTHISSARIGSARIPLALLRILLPGVMGRLLGGLLGLTMAATSATAVNAATPNTAAPAATPRTAAADLDWPTSGNRVSSTVTVHQGDTLWDLAAAQLAGPPRADDQPSAIAASWPRWWAANRRVIGADPGLIHPGQHLIVPAPQSAH